MKLADLIAALYGKSSLNGWDAVCAINVAKLNELLLNWYLNNGPANPETPVQMILVANNSYYVLSAFLGAPELQFSTSLGLQECQCTMRLVGGSLAQFDPSTRSIQNILLLQPDLASISGTLILAKAPGQAQLGELTLDLASGTYTPSISGIASQSPLAATLGDAFQTYFANQSTIFHLGGVTTSESIQKCLQPQSFEIAVQANRTSGTTGDGCVLLLIQTTGSGGSVNVLTEYPIPDEFTASLLVSNEILFNNLFPSALNSSPTNSANEITFESQQASGGIYQASLQKGAADLGVQTDTNSSYRPQTSDGQFDSGSETYLGAPIVADLSGLVLTPLGGNQGSLTWTYSKEWTQGFAYASTNVPRQYNQKYATASATLTYNATASATITSPATCIVSFPLSGKAGFTFTMSRTLEGEIGEIDFGSLIISPVETYVEEIFDAIATVPDVDTFALQNLLFYPNQSLSLSSASLPGDLLLVGDTVSPIVISPAQVSIAAGASPIQFSATLNGQPVSDAIWEIVPNRGSIVDGLYTPPADSVDSLVIKITATSGSNSGNALVIVSTPQTSGGIQISPGAVAICADQSYTFTFTDSNGNPVDVNCSLSPSGDSSGTVENSFGWSYTAPNEVDSPLTVTLTATSTQDSSLTGTATIYLVTSNNLVITASQASVGPGGTVNLSTALPDEVEELVWIIFSSSSDPAGNIAVSQNGSNEATYTAPAAVTAPVTIQAVAYGYDATNGAVAFGAVGIQLSA
jgi:hypothetical protein